MSQPLPANIPPLLASDLDDKWALRVRNALLEGQRRIGVGPDASIQITNRYGDFMPLMLPHGGIRFVNTEEAQKAIDMLGVAQV